jgi:hypothetical protein
MKRKKTDNVNGEAGNHFSPDGKWETMARPPCLMRYTPNGVFYARLKYKRKVLMKSLETDDYPTACDRLPDYIKARKEEYDRELKSAKQKAVQPTIWKTAAEQYDAELTYRAQMSQITFTTAYNNQAAIRMYAFYWPSIVKQAVRDIVPHDCLKFFAEAGTGTGRFVPREKGLPTEGSFLGGVQCNTAYNNMLSVANHIVKIAQERDLKANLPAFQNPFAGIKFKTFVFKKLVMPSDDEWAKILEAIGTPHGRKDPAYREEEALLAEFISMVGPRISECIPDVATRHPEDPIHPGLRFKHLKKGSTTILSAKEGADNEWVERDVPWIDGAEDLMGRIREKLYHGDDNAHVFAHIGLDGLKLALPRAIRKCGLQKKLKGFSQHKIRHLFGTVCAEANISWKILAEWLGHSDGGVLAAKLYSHVRVEVSADQARKVSYHKKSPGATGTQQGSTA